MISRNDDDKSLNFLIFHCTSLLKDNEKSKQSDILSHVLFRYKVFLSDEELENFLNAIISIYTFTTISIGDKEVQFLSFDSFKVAVHTFLLDDNSCVFFILRTTSDFLENIIHYTLNRISNILFFLLGNSYKTDIKILQSFLIKEGDKIISIAIKARKLNLLKYNIAFPSLSKIKSENEAIIVTTLLSSIKKLSLNIWGVSCFIDQKLLISQIPISICALFQFIPVDGSSLPVFLTKSQREQIIQSPNFQCAIPDLDIIPSFLLVFTDSSKKIAFYVLTDFSFLKEESLIAKIKGMVDVSFPYIYENYENMMQEETTTNIVSYDSYLLDLTIGKDVDDYEENIMMSRDALLNDNRITEIIMKNPKDLTICYKTISLEHYTCIEENRKDSFLEMYQKCINLNPALKQYIDVFSPNESS